MARKGCPYRDRGDRSQVAEVGSRLAARFFRARRHASTVVDGKNVVHEMRAILDKLAGFVIFGFVGSTPGDADVYVWSDPAAAKIL